MPTITPDGMGVVKVLPINNVSNDVQVQPVVILVSQSVMAPNTTALMTIYTNGTLAVAGTSAWAVPSGMVFRAQRMGIVAVSSAVLVGANMALIKATATAQLTVTATVGMVAVLPYVIPAATTPFNEQGFNGDVAAGNTIGIGIVGGTSHTVIGAVVQGYLF